MLYTAIEFLYLCGAKKFEFHLERRAAIRLSILSPRADRSDEAQLCAADQQQLVKVRRRDPPCGETIAMPTWQCVYRELYTRRISRAVLAPRFSDAYDFLL